jgi:phenylacetate-CoA ligase
MLIRDKLIRLTAWAKKKGSLDNAVRYNPLVHGRVFQCIDQFARADEDERRRLSNLMTESVLRHARRTDYGKAFKGPIDDWPTLGKEQLRDDCGAFVRPKLARVPAATGGTTGIPIRLWRSLASVAAEQAFIDHLHAVHHVKLAHARVATLRPGFVKPVDDRSPPFGIQTHGGRRLVLSDLHLCKDTVDWYVGALERFRPDVVWVFPTALANLMRCLAASSRRLRFPVVVSTCAVLPPDTLRQIEETFGARVVDYYGQAERLCFAVSEGPERYRFQPAYGRVELIPSELDQVDGARRHVQIIATGYWNDAMPLVRYETGDFAVVPVDSSDADLEAIALGLVPFYGIAGRTDEYILAPNGTEIIGLNHLPREVANLLQIQIVQDAVDAVTVRVLALPDFGEADAGKLMSNARLKFPSSMRVDIRIVERLESNASGKTPFVIRRLADRAFVSSPSAV